MTKNIWNIINHLTRLVLVCSSLSSTTASSVHVDTCRAGLCWDCTSCESVGLELTVLFSIWISAPSDAAATAAVPTLCSGMPHRVLPLSPPSGAADALCRLGWDEDTARSNPFARFFLNIQNPLSCFLSFLPSLGLPGSLGLPWKDFHKPRWCWWWDGETSSMSTFPSIWSLQSAAASQSDVSVRLMLKTCKLMQIPFTSMLCSAGHVER